MNSLMLLVINKIVNTTAAPSEGTGIWGTIIAISGLLSPIVIEIIKCITQRNKPNPTQTISQQINSNNKFVYIDKSKHITSTKTVINKAPSHSQSSDTESEFFGILFVAFIVVCAATILSIIILKYRLAIAAIMDILLFCISIYFILRGRALHINLISHDNILLCLFGMALPYFSLVNLAPRESFEQYRSRLVNKESKDFPSFINHLANGISADGWSTFYFISVAIGVVIAGLYVYLYYFECKKINKNNGESTFNRKTFFIIGEISMFFSIGGSYWLIYWIQVLFIMGIEWLKVFLPKLI